MNEYIAAVLADYDKNSQNDTTPKTARVIYEAVSNWFEENNLVSGSSSDSSPLVFSAESLTAGNNKINANQLESVGSAKLGDLLTAIGFPTGSDLDNERRRDALKALAVELYAYRNGEVIGRHFTNPVAQSAETLSIGSLHSSAFANSAIMSPMQAWQYAVEEFGAASNNISLDAKLAITVSILAFRKSIATRGYNFATTTSDTVIFKSERNELYDISTIGVGGNKDYNYSPFIDLYENPAMADTLPKLVKVLTANDDIDDPVLLADEVLIPGKNINLFHMSKIAGAPGYDSIDISDFLNDNARIDALLIRISNADASVTEEYEILANDAQGALFAMTNNSVDSMDRSMNTKMIITLNGQSKTTAGATTSLLSTLSTENRLTVEASVAGTLSLTSALIHVHGSANKTVSRVDGGPVVSAIATAMKALKVELVGYKVKAYYSEENIRKSTVSMKAAYRTFTYAIPASKSVIVQYSLETDVQQVVVKGVDELIRIGVDNRTLVGTLDVLNNVKRRLDEEALNKEGYPRGKLVMDEYVAGYISRPSVRIQTYDVSAKTLTRESSKGQADKRTEFEYFLNGIVTALKTSSFFDKQLDGEIPTWTVIMSPQILAAILDLQYVHAPRDSKDGHKVPDGEFEGSYQLPCGDQLKILTTTFADFKNKMLVIPVRKKDGDAIGFGTVVNKGTFAGSVPYTAANASSYKFISNIRQWMIATNPVGALINVTNIDAAYY